MHKPPFRLPGGRRPRSFPGGVRDADGFPATVRHASGEPGPETRHPAGGYADGVRKPCVPGRVASQSTAGGIGKLVLKTLPGS